VTDEVANPSWRAAGEKPPQAATTQKVFSSANRSMIFARDATVLLATNVFSPTGQNYGERIFSHGAPEQHICML
jgi:hypothetical protein